MRTRTALMTLLLVACDSAEPGTPALDAGSAHGTDAGSDAGTPSGDCGPECPEDRCFAARCLVEPPPACRADADCDDGQRCSAAGLCFAGACQIHSDCAASERCLAGRCLARVENPAGVQFERVYIPALQAHTSTPNIPEDQAEELMFAGGTGFGVAPVDFDGDLDLDLFVGAEGGVSACLYVNRSQPTEPIFEPVEAYCDEPVGKWHGGVSIDLEGDGVHELILFGAGQLAVQRFGAVPSRRDLMALLPEGDIRRQCNVGSVLPHDFDYDGRIDVLVGCSLDMLHGTQETFRNLLFLQDSDAELQFVSQADWARGESIIHRLESSTLALGLADLDDDGLGDVIVNEDILAYLVIETPDPGGVYFACPPDEDCRFTVERFASGERANGAYMGSGVLRLGDHPAQHLYLTDIADNRLLRMTDSGFRNITSSANAGFGYLGGEGVYSWGVVVDDFDLDGRDDVFVGNGAVPGHTPADFAMHLDLMLLQKEAGRFAWHSSDIGIDPFTTQDTGHAERTYATRAVVKLDLDLDGRIDIVSAGMEGAPRIHREVPILNHNVSRCTLVPVARYVPGHASGYQLILPGDPRPRQWDSQGQVRSGTSPHILTPAPQGTLVFPSGAKVDYDCTDRFRPLLVVEPRWLGFDRVGERLELTLGPEAPADDVSVLIEGQELTPASPERDGVWSLPVPSEGFRFMLKFGERWTPRWFETPARGD